MMPRESWTDNRLDDLSNRVDALERRMDEGFKEMREEFRAVRAEMQAMHRTTMQIVLGGFATTFVGLGATIATVLLTQG